MQLAEFDLNLVFFISGQGLLVGRAQPLVQDDDRIVLFRTGMLDQGAHENSQVRGEVVTDGVKIGIVIFLSSTKQFCICLTAGLSVAGTH